MDENEEKKLKEKIQTLLLKKTDQSFWITWDEYLNLKKLGFDVETINDIKKRELPYIYDIGGKINDLLFDYINTDIFYASEKMTSCFYKKKIPLYQKIISKEQVKIKLKKKYLIMRQYLTLYPNKQMCQQLKKTMRTEKVDLLCAFNIKFDFGALIINFTQCKESIRLLVDTDCVDTRLIAIRCMYDNPEELEKYKEFCKKNDYLTISGNCKTDMQTFGAFYMGKRYKEEHMGFFDTIDETKLTDEIIPKVYEKYGRLDKLKVEVNNMTCRGITYAPFKIID